MPSPITSDSDLAICSSWTSRVETVGRSSVRFWEFPYLENGFPRKTLQETDRRSDSPTDEPYSGAIPDPVVGIVGIVGIVRIVRIARIAVVSMPKSFSARPNTISWFNSGSMPENI